MVVDEELSFFGSSNLDHRSLIINFENCILVKDKKLASDFQEIFDNYLKYSLVVDKAFIKKYIPLRKRIGHELLQIYKPLV
jgi:phosphatidylserine/phosphatidylglycerophosphate/cardiolipin synthase-like enzyme